MPPNRSGGGYSVYNKCRRTDRSRDHGRYLKVGGQIGVMNGGIAPACTAFGRAGIGTGGGRPHEGSGVLPPGILRTGSISMPLMTETDLLSLQGVARVVG